MKERSTTSGQVIIVYSEHPTFGSLLIPYLAERDSSGNLSLAEQAFHASDKALASMHEAEREAILISSHYTDKYLMGIYSREKTVARFLRKLSEEPNTVKNNIRPFIEKKLFEMLALIRATDLPLYQKQSGGKVLYAHNAYHINRHDVEICFTFHVDAQTFKYQLQCFYDGQPFSLSEQKPAIALTSSPATLLLGMELYSFPNIESARLLPFTKKEAISVDIAQLNKYIDNIVIPIARYHKITAHGLEITEEQRICKATLTLEDTIYDEPLLALNFQYGDQSFVPEVTNNIKTIIYRNEAGDIHSFRRDREQEIKALQLLSEVGLCQVSDAHFTLSPDAQQKTITEWIFQHREMLQQSFQLIGATQSTAYCLDEIHIEQSYDDGPDWFELHITVVIGDFRIPFSRFRKHILEERREYQLPDGRLILLPEEWFSKYGNLLEMGTVTEKGIRLKHIHIGAISPVLNEAERKMLPTREPIPEIAAPKKLKAQLRPYQQKGFSWMTQLYKQHFGGCLADDMGLGKTLQTLTLLQSIYQPGDQEAEAPLVLCPYTEVASETDDQGQLSLFSFTSEDELLPKTHPIESPSAPLDSTKKVPHRASTLIVVPTSLLHNWRQEAKRFTTLSMFEYHSNVVIPKGQPERLFGRFHLIFISYGTMRKNIDILKQYCFEYVVLDESQNIKNSESLTFRSAIQLQSNHRLALTGTPIENSLKDLWAQFHFLQPDLLGEETDFQKLFITPIRQGNTRMEMRLQQLISPFILRRSKREVAPELPPLTEETIYCEMTEEQHAYYEKEKNSLRNILLQQPKTAERHNTLNILNGILRLRQLVCHPQLISPDFNGNSGKMELIIEIFDTLQSEGHKVLIFSSFVKHLELIAQAFRQRGWEYALLTGSTTDRPSEIAHFTEQKNVQAFLISLKAGGVGLNLTEADYVFIIDPWWNPAAEAQAIARAHRIGQNKQVIAYRFITQDSIEEKILLLQDEKRKLAELFISDNETLPHLSEQEWVDLLQ